MTEHRTGQKPSAHDSWKEKTEKLKPHNLRNNSLRFVENSVVEVGFVQHKPVAD